MPPILFDHIKEKLNEVRFFQKALETMHDVHLEHISRSMRPFDEKGKPIARAFQYQLSALLSAHRAVRYYIIMVSKRVAGTKGWRDQVDDNVVLEAFHHLRDVDIHDETLNIASRITLRNLQGTPEVRLSGLILDERSLKGIKRLARQPEALKYLMSKNIIEIVREGVTELERIVAEGRALGYLAPQRLSSS